MEIGNNRKEGFRLFEGKRPRRGQSLVEFALTLPVLLTILAGVVEVANILTIYNRVQTAAREGARFGAMGGTNSGMRDVMQQASKDSLTVSDAQMRMWVIKPTIQVSGTTLIWASPVTATSWAGKAECVYPLAPPNGPGCADTSPLAPSQVLNDIKVINSTSWASIDDTDFVVAVVQYDTDMILRLPWFSPPDTNGRFRMWAYATQRLEVSEESIAQKSGGCSAYSLALSDTAIPANVQEGDTFTRTLNAPWDGESRRQGFGFLGWNKDNADNPSNVNNNSSGCQRGSMSFPGNSVNCSPFSYVEYPEVPPLDTSLHKLDWVIAHPVAVSPGLWNEMVSTGGHADLGRALRIIIYNYQAGDQNPRYEAPFWQYRIDRFAIVRLVQAGSDHNNNPPTLSFEWVRWDDSCGNP